jgi:Putative phage serine protease XkdF
MDLPVYELKIDDSADSNLAMSAIALVQSPAVQKNFLAFSEQVKELKFSAVDLERGIISGLLISANKPIYRNDSMGEYYVTISPEESYKFVQKFFKEGYNQKFNLNHDDNAPAEGVTLFECFISDSTRGIAPMKGFDDEQDGSVFISCKVDNEAIKQQIIDGTIKGFSMQGDFGMKRVENTDALTPQEFEFYNEVLNKLQNLQNEFTN